MMKLQKLVVVMSALAGGIAAMNSHALGLGEVKLYSALNQPLVAEIELMQVNDLTRNEILSNLASKTDFERAGVERPFILNNLRFTTKVGPDGKGLIKVTSDSPVHEPYLNFLVEVHWPSGRLLKEYTLLLDPPAFNGQTSAPVVKPASIPPHYGTNPVWDQPPRVNGNRINRNYTPSQEAIEYRDSIQRQQVQRVSSRRDDASSDLPGSTPGTYRVNRNDSLWEIAEKVRPDSEVTVQQTMLAIQRGNPQAFIDNNINRLKSGQVLRIPGRNEMTRLTVREAVADVSRQNREWRGRSQVAQLDATRRTSSIASDSRKSLDGQLAIVSGDAASGRGQDLGGDAAGGNAVLQTELAMTREQLDKLSRENAELKSRLKDLDDQIATLKRLVALKDDQMAALQNQSRSLPTQRQAETVSGPGMMATLFGNPLIMLLLALIPLGGAGWLFYQRRRKQQEALDDEDVDIQPVNLNKEAPIDASPKPTASPSAEDELKFDEALAIDDSIINEVDADGETTGQTEDPLSEADIYIAYGRLDQAEELLTQAILNEPGRSDLKLKLLEVHSESGDLEKFNQVLADLEATGDHAAMRAAEVFKARFSDAFEGVSAPDQINEMPDLDLDGLELDGDEQGFDSLDDLDFDLDDFDLDEEPEAAEQFETSELDDLDDLDFGVESDDVLARDSQAAFSDEGGSNLEASLDDDLDFLSEGDEVATKIDLARAYMDMGDSEGASAILQEVMEQGSDEQKQEAMLLMQNAGTS
ncbi:FimV family protein [Thalassotalea sp. G20_0]|uniref:FimV/HubP family polar landmark protein n=1 Tax=Thalassotalea sp. G20_0 TaxID=2821093 RepID=UPI001ADB366A|nr:FimV/HubP family polar landmark protein [Thalassotalea sp. G20_0]MBO9493972.1 FimV family protein [Thalassotalea sp. G20_0]